MHELLKILRFMRHHNIELRQHKDSVQDDGSIETVGIFVSTSAAHMADACATVSLTER